MKNKKRVKVIIAVLIVLLIVLGLVYLFTDILKTEKQLFAKYIIKNMKIAEEIIDIEELENISDKLEKSKNEAQTTVEIQNSTKDKIKLTIESQNDNLKDKAYKNIKLATQDAESTIQAEIMKENEIYSLRLTNAVDKFLSIRNENLKNVAENFGLDAETINRLPNRVDSEQYPIDDVDISIKEISKYATLIYKNTPNESYSKSEDVTISHNGKNVIANQYILTLTESQVKNIELKMLEELKNDETIINLLLTIEKIANDSVDTELVRKQYTSFMQQQIDIRKEQQYSEETEMVISVFEKDGKTLRTILEKDTDIITIDSVYDEEKKVSIQYEGLDAYQNQISNTINIIKNKEKDNNITVEMINVQNGEEQKNSLNIETTQSENNIELKASVNLENQLIEKITFVSNINIVKELDFNVELNDTNNIILNDLSKTEFERVIKETNENIIKKYTRPVLEIVADFILPLAFEKIESIF